MLRAPEWKRVLLMSEPIVVQVIGTLVAGCDGQMLDSWRDATTWISEQFRRRFGEQSVVVSYYDVLDPSCPPLPAGAQLPLVLEAGEFLTCGGKLNGPAIRRRVEELGARPLAS